MDKPSTSFELEFSVPGSSHMSYDFNSWLSNVNPALFLSFEGCCINFYLKVKPSEIKKAFEKVVTAFGGSCIGKYEYISSSTVIIVGEKPEPLPKMPVFDVKYIVDCVTQNTLLDITDYAYFKDAESFKGTFMDVIFWGKAEFPFSHHFQKSSIEITSKNDHRYVAEQDHNKYVAKQDQSKCVAELVDHKNDQGSGSNESRPQRTETKNKPTIAKNTREPYSMTEKEAILKFLILHGKYDNLKGPTIWRTMERRNVCPKRTYQSMKEHFAKKIVFQLNRFPFLTEEQKTLLEKEFHVA